MLANLTTVLLQLHLSPLIKKKGFNCFGLNWMLICFERLSQPSVDFYMFMVRTSLGIQKATIYAMRKKTTTMFWLLQGTIYLYREKQQFPPIGDLWQWRQFKTMLKSWLFHLVVVLQWNCSDDAVTRIGNIRRTERPPLSVTVFTASKCHWPLEMIFWSRKMLQISLRFVRKL